MKIIQQFSVAVCLLCVGGLSWASESMPVSGSIGVVQECAVPKLRGSNLFVDLMSDMIVTGNLSGKAPRIGTFIRHAEGTGNLQSFGTFCGTIYDENENCLGRGTLELDGHIQTEGIDVSGTLVGHNGTGGLRGAHFTGSVNGTILGTANYEGEVHFDPAVEDGCDDPVPECEDMCH